MMRRTYELLIFNSRIVKLRIFSVLIGLMIFGFTVSNVFAEDLYTFQIDEHNIITNSPDIHTIDVDWDSEHLPELSVNFTKPYTGQFQIQIPKNMPRTMNLDFETTLMMDVSSLSGTEQEKDWNEHITEKDFKMIDDRISETESLCYYVITVELSNADYFKIVTGYVASGRWEPVTIHNEECDKVYDQESSIEKRSIFPLSKPGFNESLSPLKQFKSGIPSDKIQCKEGLVQVFKKSNGYPACVKPETVSELKKREWAKFQFSFCGADGFDSKGNLNKNNSTHIWDENHCEWIKNTIPKNNQIKYSDTVIENSPYNNELIIFQKDDSALLQYDKTKQVIDETFLSKTAGEWQKASWDALMQEHEKYLPENRFFDHLGLFLIKNEFQNVMNELGIVNAEDDFEVKSGMSLTSLPPHNSYYSIIKATDGNYYRLQGGTHANEVNVSKVSALLFFDTSVDFKMEDLVSQNQLFTILPESNSNKPEIEPFNLIIHTNNSKVEFYNNTPEIIRIQDSGTGTVGEEHLLDWVGPTILPYTTASMTFDEPGNFDFNARFAPNLENPLWWSTHTSGTIIVMSDDMSSVSREEKNKMAQSLLFDLGLPVVGAGTGNADNVLSVQLDPSVVDVIPNATQYYKERIEQIFPFEVVLDMGY